MPALKTSGTSTQATLPQKPNLFSTINKAIASVDPMNGVFHQPNFETLSGQNVYKPMPTTTPTYTAKGVVPSAFATLGAQGNSNAGVSQNTTGSATGGIQQAPVGNTVAQGGIFSTPNGTQIQQDASGNVVGQPNTTNTDTSGTTGQVKGLFPSVVASLANNGQQPGAAYTQAYGDAQRYNTQLTQSLQNEAGAVAQNRLNPIPIGDQTGREAVIQQQYLDQQKAIGSGLQGATSLIAGANTAQSNQNTALNNAGNLAAPQVTSYGQTSFDPTNAQFSGGGSLPPEVMQQYAQMAATGQYSAIPSFITSNPVLSAQLNVAAKAINPSYTPLQSQGAGSVLQGIPALTSANAAADGIKNTINSYLSANPSLNPSDLAAGNILQQWIQGKQLTDPKYQTLFNYINEYTNTLAPILGVGGDATNLKTQIAQGFVNAAASGKSISQVLDSMSSLATNKIQDLQNGATGGSTSVPNTSVPTGGGFSEVW